MNASQGFTLKLGNSVTGSPETLSSIRSDIFHRGNQKIRAIVVSAPGKGIYFSDKVTNLLEAIYNQKDVLLREELISELLKGFQKLAIDLGTCIEEKFSADIFLELKQVYKTRDYVLSRGEYVTAYLMGRFFGLPVVDPMTAGIVIDDSGVINNITTMIFPEENFVMPGFYGRDDISFDVRIFPRGGTDISSAIVACATNTILWRLTSSPLCYADPEIVQNPRVITCLHYDDLLAMSQIVHNVLHSNAVMLCKKYQIPIHIGTMQRITRITGDVAPDFAGVHSLNGIFTPKELLHNFDSSLVTVVVLGTGMIAKSGYISRITSLISYISISAIWSPPSSGIVYLFLDRKDRESAVRSLYDGLCKSY